MRNSSNSNININSNRRTCLFISKREAVEAEDLHDALPKPRQLPEVCLAESLRQKGAGLHGRG